MPFNVRRNGDVAIVDCTGNITLYGDSSASNLRDTIKDLAAQGEKKIVLNMAETRYIDNSALGVFVDGFSMLAKKGGTLKLLALNKKVKELLQITGLYKVFEVHDDEAAAVRSFAR